MTNNAGEHLRMAAGLARLSGKVAAVTAADSGIGRATARLFAREGAKVVCADIAERGDPRVDRLIETDGGEAHFLLGDVSQRAVCDEIVSTAVDEPAANIACLERSARARNDRSWVRVTGTVRAATVEPVRVSVKLASPSRNTTLVWLVAMVTCGVGGMTVPPGQTWVEVRRQTLTVPAAASVVL